MQLTVTKVWLFFVIISTLHHACAMEIGSAIGITKPGKAHSSARKPISLYVAYHRKSYALDDDPYKNLNIDNGAILNGLNEVIAGKVPAILINGIVAYPLLTAALTGYLQQKDMPLPDTLQELPPPRIGNHAK